MLLNTYNLIFNLMYLFNSTENRPLLDLHFSETKNIRKINYILFLILLLFALLSSPFFASSFKVRVELPPFPRALHNKSHLGPEALIIYDFSYISRIMWQFTSDTSRRQKPFFFAPLAPSPQPVRT